MYTFELIDSNLITFLFCFSLYDFLISWFIRLNVSFVVCDFVSVVWQKKSTQLPSIVSQLHQTPNIFPICACALIPIYFFSYAHCIFFVGLCGTFRILF